MLLTKYAYYTYLLIMNSCISNGPISMAIFGHSYSIIGQTTQKNVHGLG